MFDDRLDDLEVEFLVFVDHHILKSDHSHQSH